MSEQYSLIIYSNQKHLGKTIDAYLRDTPFSIKGISSVIDEVKILLKHHAPDFLIIDLNHSCSHLNIHPLKITSPRTRIIIIEKTCHSQNIFKLIQAGADSFLPLPFTREDTIQMLTNLIEDEIHLPPFVAKSILYESQMISQKKHEYPFILTTRDREILWCISRGMDLEKIKSCLGIDESLIRAHLTNTIQKIHFSDIVQNHFNEKLLEVKSEFEHFEII